MHLQTIKALKEICTEIGCSGVDPDMCQNRPQQCLIIRKLVKPSDERGPDVAALRRLISLESNLATLDETVADHLRSHGNDADEQPDSGD